MVPVGGFANLKGSVGNQKFTIARITLETDPTKEQTLKTHTCFNKLDLPEYPTFKRLKSEFDYFIQKEFTGFDSE